MHVSKSVINASRDAERRIRRMYYAVDTTGVRSATGTAQAVDRYGLITYSAQAPRVTLEIVVTEVGAFTTVNTLKTSPLPASLIPVPQVSKGWPNKNRTCLKVCNSCI